MTKVTEFIDQVVKETKKISWAPKKETHTSVLIVVAIVFFASLFFMLVDFSSYKAIQLLLNLGVN